MNLSPAQKECLKAIAQQSGHCPKGYSFRSAAVLDRLGLIKGQMMTPYWWWDLTDEGKQILNLLNGKRTLSK